MATNTIQIFRPGKHTSANGSELTFGEADLQGMVDSYNPELHEAPIVVGHPSDNAPAYGWVKGLKFADGALEAVPHQVDPDFAELVKAGRFRKVSASFYLPDSPSNPVPGKYYLRHVGFLGAQPPAVKGLKNASFADANEGIVEFADWADMTNASLWRRLRDWLIGEKGLDVADSIIPDYSISTLEQDALQGEPDDAPASPGFSEPSTKGDMMSAEEKARLAALEKENAELKARQAAARLEGIRSAHASFAEDLVTAGKLLPAYKGAIVETLCFLESQEKVVEFSEGNTKMPLVDALKAFVSALPKQVEFRELAGGKDAGEPSDDPAVIGKKAAEFMEAEAKAGRIVSSAEAVQHVIKGGA